jgi:hypothetical protein
MAEITLILRRPFRRSSTFPKAGPLTSSQFIVAVYAFDFGAYPVRTTRLESMEEINDVVNNSPLDFAPIFFLQSLDCHETGLAEIRGSATLFADEAAALLPASGTSSGAMAGGGGGSEGDTEAAAREERAKFAALLK